MKELASVLERLTETSLRDERTAPSIAVAVEIDEPYFFWQGGAARGCAVTEAAAETPFRIASVTKPFVAAAMHRLIEERRVSLDTPVTAAATGETVILLEAGGYDPGSIQIAHLLSHTSGLPDHTGTPGYRDAIQITPRRRWLRREQIALAVLEGTRQGAPGETYSYSDTGYVLLGEIIEQVTGDTLATAIRELLDFEAIGLGRTWWELLEQPGHEQPAPAVQWIDGTDASRFDCSFDLFGGGGLISTVSDLNRFFRALLVGKIIGVEQLVGALATPAARRSAKTADWRTHSYIMSTMAAGRNWVLGHTGSWGCLAVRVPAFHASIALTLNAGGDASFTAARSLLDDIVDAIFAHRESRYV